MSSETLSSAPLEWFKVWNRDGPIAGGPDFESVIHNKLAQLYCNSSHFSNDELPEVSGVQLLRHVH